jgi:hypothetical protein
VNRPWVVVAAVVAVAVAVAMIQLAAHIVVQMLVLQIKGKTI